MNWPTICPSCRWCTRDCWASRWRPCSILAGVLDTQVPIEDEYLLLSKGDVPKEAWINPRGGHLGRQVGVWPDPRIFKQVIIPWLVKTLQAPAN